MEERPFGKIGVKFPIISFGAQRVVDAHGCSESQALKILNHALDRGIRYFDTAWVYSDGQSEERVGKVARHRRKEMWIATKTITRTAKESRLQLEESLRRLQTDHIDEWRLHNVWSLEELDKVIGSGGSLEAAIQARNKGMVRYISISGHTNPKVQIEALNRFPFDSVLCAVSVLDHFILSFAEEFLPIANAKGVAIIGMKVLGLGVLAPYYEKALRYTLSLPISTAIVGMETMEQLEKNLVVAENFKPLTDEERLELFREIMPQVTPQRVMWKAEDWKNPTSWKKR